MFNTNKQINYLLIHESIHNFYIKVEGLTISPNNNKTCFNDINNSDQQSTWVGI